MKNLVVFDLDGVIFNSEHRYPLYQAGKYREWVAAAGKDEALMCGVVCATNFLFHPFYKVLFVTARGDDPQHRKTTLEMLQWYIDKSVANDQLLMKSWDVLDEPDHVSKPRMIEEAGYSLDDIFLVFEDRKSIVDMWRARGVRCFQTQPGDY